MFKLVFKSETLAYKDFRLILQNKIVPVDDGAMATKGQCLLVK